MSSKTSTLAPIQRKVLEFLRNYTSEHRCAPSLKEIVDHLGAKSQSTAHFHVERLQDKGFITRGEDGSIEFNEVFTAQLGPTAVPLVGVIAAGHPIEAIENKTFIEVPSEMIDGRGEVFCLEVSGSSMIDEHICDGDIVVIQKQDVAENGQIVAALLSDGSATLKTYRRLKNGTVMLIPANTTMKPIVVEGDVTIQGRLVAVLRRYH